MQLPGNVDVLVRGADLARRFDQRPAPVDTGERNRRLRPARHARSRDQRGTACEKTAASECSHDCDLLLLASVRSNLSTDTLNPRSCAIRLRSAIGWVRSISYPSCRIVEIFFGAPRGAQLGIRTEVSTVSTGL